MLAVVRTITAKIASLPLALHTLGLTFCGGWAPEGSVKQTDAIPQATAAATIKLRMR
jgi:hypothetical protein